MSIETAPCVMPVVVGLCASIELVGNAAEHSRRFFEAAAPRIDDCLSM